MIKINNIFSYLTYPGKGKSSEDQIEIAGAVIPQQGRLHQMLTNVFARSETECDILIYFPSFDGTQYNECRAEVVELLYNPGVATGRKLAQRLQAVTTNRSGLGLLFLTIGQLGTEMSLLISRFPADQGIIAEQNAATLRVEFVEEVFLKSAQSYKAVLYRGSSLDVGFWKGNAVDKQVNHRTRDLATYWIRDFLRSDFQTTARAGTKRLAVALRSAAAQTNDLSVKREIAAAATLGVNLAGESTTIKEFCERSQLSTETWEVIKTNVKRDKLVNDRFEFDADEFSRHLVYKTIELDNGAVLTAQLEDFDRAFKKQQVEDSQDQYTYTTRGRVVDERLKKSR